MNHLEAREAAGLMQGLGIYALAFAFAAPLRAWTEWTRGHIALLWRVALTRSALDAGKCRTAQWEERVQEDIRVFTEDSTELWEKYFSAGLNGVAFGTLLYAYSPHLLFCLLGYLWLGARIMHCVGLRLPQLIGIQVSQESSFRDLLRSHFAPLEALRALKDIAAIRQQILCSEWKVIALRHLHHGIALLLPIALLSQGYLAGELALGDLLQAQGAFYHVLTSAAVVVSQFERISEVHAHQKRLEGIFKP
jgi:ABC-type uncharacterized transport system fused permease/ATPase subunit